MRITEITAWTVSVPTLSEWMSSPEFGAHSSGDLRTLLRLKNSAGAEGWGESAGDRLEAIGKIADRLLGRNITDFRANHLDLWGDDEIYWNRPSHVPAYRPAPANVRHRLRHPLQCLLECALTDLLSRATGVPISHFFGGSWRDRVLTDYWAGRTTPDQAALCAKRAKILGFRGIKLKTTLEDPNVERLVAISEAAGRGFHVTIDPNGRFYRFDDAWPVIRDMDRIGNMRILEDPFPRFHLGDFKRLRERLNARLAVHVDPPESLWSVLSAEVAGGLNLDSHQIGPSQWRILAGAAEQANLPIWHGGGIDLGVGTAWQLHLASCAPNCRLPGDQAGPWLREHTLVREIFRVEDGHVLVPEGAGIGVQVDLDAVERYMCGTKTWTDL